MKKDKSFLHVWTGCALTLLTSLLLHAEYNLDKEKLQKHLAHEFEKLELLAKNPTIVDAVRRANLNRTKGPSYTNESWAKLSPSDEFVLSLTHCDAAKVIRASISTTVSEAFLSAADGTKVAFLSKTTNWNHKGKPKHDVPMKGKTWTGNPELDASTGRHQIQISVPVLDSGKPIGSLVLGLDLVRMDL